MIGPLDADIFMFEIVDDGRRTPPTTTDGRRTMGILKAHLRAFGSGELISYIYIWFEMGLHKVFTFSFDKALMKDKYNPLIP